MGMDQFTAQVAGLWLHGRKKVPWSA